MNLITRKIILSNYIFSYSNAAFIQVFESQNQECVTEVLEKFFNFIIGVPTVIVIDNMNFVVKKVFKNEEKEISEGFKRFTLSYIFRIGFCNFASNNEKGNVENITINIFPLKRR